MQNLGSGRTAGNTSLSSLSERNFRKNVVLNQLCTADQARLRHTQGPGASDVLCGCCSKPEFRIEAGPEPKCWRESDCPCRLLRFVANVGLTGQQRSPQSRVQSIGQAVVPERTLARVCREAGATVRYNAKLRDMDLAVSAKDDRAIEVLATGLVPNWRWTSPFGAPLRRTGQQRASRMDGAVCTRAREDKERKYSEFFRADRCRLVVVARETGRRGSAT